MHVLIGKKKSLNNKPDLTVVSNKKLVPKKGEFAFCPASAGEYVFTSSCSPHLSFSVIVVDGLNQSRSSSPPSTLLKETTKSTNNHADRKQQQLRNLTPSPPPPAASQQPPPPPIDNAEAEIFKNNYQSNSQKRTPAKNAVANLSQQQAIWDEENRLKIAVSALEKTPTKASIAAERKKLKAENEAKLLAMSTPPPPPPSPPPAASKSTKFTKSNSNSNSNSNNTYNPKTNIHRNVCVIYITSEFTFSPSFVRVYRNCLIQYKLSSDVSRSNEFSISGKNGYDHSTVFVSNTLQKEFGKETYEFRCDDSYPNLIAYFNENDEEMTGEIQVVDEESRSVSSSQNRSRNTSDVSSNASSGDYGDDSSRSGSIYSRGSSSAANSRSGTPVFFEISDNECGENDRERPKKKKKKKKKEGGEGDGDGDAQVAAEIVPPPPTTTLPSYITPPTKFSTQLLQTPTRTQLASNHNLAVNRTSFTPAKLTINPGQQVVILSEEIKHRIEVTKKIVGLRGEEDGKKSVCFFR